MTLEMGWLSPCDETWHERLAAAKKIPWHDAKPLYVHLSKTGLDPAQTIKLDRAVQRHLQSADKGDGDLIRIAVLGSSTLAHLIPGIRVGALRRGLIAQVLEGDFGLYLQELSDPGSALHAFQPQVLLLALDARHVIGSDTTDPEQAIARIRHCWSLARDAFDCAVIQQTLLPVFQPALGNNDHRLPESPSAKVDRINFMLRETADEAGVHLLAIDSIVRIHGGIDAWYDPSLWNFAKQEVGPRASHLYGDYVGRILGALRGRSAKCLVLDLDNTLWGGVIGDDGLEGIVLGQGNATGEAFVEFQRYAKSLLRQGVILAVCSKNDEANALLPFNEHPEMALKTDDIACFVANWSDKAQNLRTIAATLNIGLDSLVFADDNPAEQGLIRRELPMVSVPVMPEDPADYVRCLARAGYFEALAITKEDRERGSLYAANAARTKMQESITDLASYFAALQMKLIWKPFDQIGLTRVVQLANKTNQFNLRTIRYTDADIARMIGDPDLMTLELRLTDIHGDNGIIGVIIGRKQNDVLFLESWLMSCRVLKRGVEEATMNLVVAQARAMGIAQIVGEYRATAKNAMVHDHYPQLGFRPLPDDGSGDLRWALDVADYRNKQTDIETIGGNIGN